jgi:hypothetical protein
MSYKFLVSSTEVQRKDINNVVFELRLGEHRVFDWGRINGIFLLIE